MKSNQKGFTLIELLAVIVILAIIALIATPIVLNIITKAKKSAAADSVYGTMEALKLAYTESLLDAGEQKPLPWTVDFSNSKIMSGESADVDTEKTLKVSGTKPESGTIKLDDEGNFTVTAVKVNGLTCNQTDGKVVCG